MNQTMRWLVGVGVLSAMVSVGALTPTSAEEAGSYAAEKAKALASPYPNDFGPATIDVSSYPKDLQDTYKNLLPKCARCHELSRPLNSQFLEPSGEKPGQAGKVAAWKASNPEMFQDKQVWQIEPWTASQP